MVSKKVITRNLKKGIKQPKYAFEALKSRTKSYLTYKFCNGFSAYPETISLYLTYRCNLRCKMCGQWGEEGSSKELSSDILKSELTLDELKSLIDDVASFKPNITLFGGEPFLYKGVIELIKYIKDAKLRCNTVTNGVYIGKYAQELIKLGMDEIIISIHGLSQKHDEVTNIPGTFDKIAKGLQKLERLKTERNKTKPIINITTPITDMNYQELEDIVDYWDNMGVFSVRFHHLIFFSQETYEKHEQRFRKEFCLDSPSWAGFIRESSGIDVEILQKVLDKINQKIYNIDVSFYPELKKDEINKYYSDEEFIPESYPLRCMSPWMEVYIFPDGSVRPCLSMDYIAGNIREESFLKIWNNEQYRQYRIVIKEETFPVCTKCTEFYRF